MDWAPWFDGPRCRACGQQSSLDVLECEGCGGALRAIPVDDFEPDRLDSRGQLLPISFPERGIAPGNTPLVRSAWLEGKAAVGHLLVKDEGRNPTGHVSDRDMHVAAAAASLLQIDTIALASPGRTGVAAAAAASPHDISATVYVPSRSPFPTKAMINVHGGEMSVVGGRYPDAEEAYHNDEDDQWSVAPFTNPYARAGRATLYLELLADLAGSVPDTIVVPTGTGAGIVAIADAAHLAHAAGITDALPRLVAAQPAGCAPIVEAFATEESITTVENPDTICGELEIPQPDGGAAALAAIIESGGEAIAVPDPAALEAAVRLADRTGLSISVAGGVAAAAATDLTVGKSDDTVVVINPGAGGLDADVLRSHLMSQGI